MLFVGNGTFITVLLAERSVTAAAASALLRRSLVRTDSMNRGKNRRE